MHRLVLKLPNLADHHCCAKLGPSLQDSIGVAKWWSSETQCLPSQWVPTQPCAQRCSCDMLWPV